MHAKEIYHNERSVRGLSSIMATLTIGKYTALTYKKCREKPVHNSTLPSVLNDIGI